MLIGIQQSIHNIKQWQREANSKFVPIGTILLYAGRTIPNGWLLCDGSKLDPFVHPEHFALSQLILSTYGEMYQLPDLRGRCPIGVDSRHLLGQPFGEETHTLTVHEIPSHRHYGPNHTHSGTTHRDTSSAIYYDAPRTVSPNSFVNIYATSGSRWCETQRFNSIGYHTHDFVTDIGGGESTTSVGDSLPHNIMQPSLTINFLIKY